MLDRPSPRDAATAAEATARPPRWPFAVMAWAGLLGAAGVGVGAAGAHAGGGDLTRIASTFLLIHAAALVAGCGVALAMPRGSRLLPVALALIALGAPLFGGELALAGLRDWRPVPLAAPAGGLCLIAGWLLLAATGLRLGSRRR
jgi:uncharacterized membrane protein YgdD (TMEM256/DUF423 family)